ncbi:hypothetical protein BpHYR1_030064 [Brachionus plicatilis]|uniref:Uncharacterized protein n=1 Tax=Brachionus plicatilis TaxID=10195 RepID=A0A3M7SYS0_BRAPC|nr:hypothetical protein BpHYR1_030064 [Brachionus plicatilis]
MRTGPAWPPSSSTDARICLRLSSSPLPTALKNSVSSSALFCSICDGLWVAGPPLVYAFWLGFWRWADA